MKKQNIELLSRAKVELSPSELQKFNQSLNYFLEGNCPIEVIEENLSILETHLPNLRWIEEGFDVEEYIAIDEQLDLAYKMLDTFDFKSLPKQLQNTKKIIRDYKESIIRNSTKSEKLSLGNRKYVPFKEPKNDDKYGKLFVEKAKEIIKDSYSDIEDELKEHERNKIKMDSLFHHIPEYEGVKSKPKLKWLDDPLNNMELWDREYLKKKIKDKELIRAILEREKVDLDRKKKENEQLSKDLDKLSQSQLVASFFIKNLKEELQL